MRFGSKTELSDGKNRVECNTVESILNTSNKETMKILFMKNKVSSPELYLINSIEKPIKVDATDGKEVKHIGVKINELPFPLIAKRKFHQRGIGMYKINDLDQLKTFLNDAEFKSNSYHFEKFFSGSQEFRLHVSPLLEKEIFSVKKVRTVDEKGDLPWHFHLNEGAFLKDFEKPKNWKEIVEECKKAVAALKLDVGAVDVRLNKDATKIMVIEVNSAPGMGDLTTDHYINGLKEILTKKHEKVL